MKAEFIITGYAVLVMVSEIKPNIINVELLWLDSFSPKNITLPNIGVCVIPDSFVGKKERFTIHDIELKII